MTVVYSASFACPAVQVAKECLFRPDVHLIKAVWFSYRLIMPETDRAAVTNLVCVHHH